MPRFYVPPAMRRAIDAQQQKSLKPVQPRVRPATIGQEYYSQRVRVPLQGGYGTATVSGSGAATVTVGPMGVGTVWYPLQLGCGTSTGPNDASTCAFYIGPLAALTLIGSQSYAGGGDSVGLSGQPMFPGFFIVAVWAGGHAGDLAALTVYGQQDSLAVPT